jgi:uncharacterized membrane protein YccC
VLKLGVFALSTSTIAKASRVERAFERLEAAVDRLDVALSSRGAGEIGDSDNEAIDRLRRENAELKDLNRAAADRLANTIQRLDSLLIKPEDD